MDGDLNEVHRYIKKRIFRKYIHIKFRRTMTQISVNASLERRKELLDKLPKSDLTGIIMQTFQEIFEKQLAPIFREALLKEIEVFRSIPKPNNSFNLDTFNPTTNGNCFMGQGFFANGDVTDADLIVYREKVGIIEHPVWGGCTILEIWGADHFLSHSEMVKDVWKYVTGKTDKIPEVQIVKNAFSYSLASYQTSENYRIIQTAMEKAMFFDHGLTIEKYNAAKAKGEI